MILVKTNTLGDLQLNRAAASQYSYATAANAIAHKVGVQLSQGLADLV